MSGLGEPEEGGGQEWRGLFSGIMDKINALAFIPFIRMKAFIHSLFPPFSLCISLSVGRAQWVSSASLAQEAHVKGKEQKE